MQIFRNVINNIHVTVFGNILVTNIVLLLTITLIKVSMCIHVCMLAKFGARRPSCTSFYDTGTSVAVSHLSYQHSTNPCIKKDLAAKLDISLDKFNLKLQEVLAKQLFSRDISEDNAF